MTRDRRQHQHQRVVDPGSGFRRGGCCLATCRSAERELPSLTSPRSGARWVRTTRRCRPRSRNPVSSPSEAARSGPLVAARERAVAAQRARAGIVRGVRGRPGRLDQCAHAASQPSPRSNRSVAVPILTPDDDPNEGRLSAWRPRAAFPPRVATASEHDIQRHRQSDHGRRGSRR